MYLPTSEPSKDSDQPVYSHDLISLLGALWIVKVKPWRKYAYEKPLRKHSYKILTPLNPTLI